MEKRVRSGGKEVEIDSRLLDDYVGKFRVAGIIFEFFKENDGLVVNQSGVPGKTRIYAESETTFFYKVVDARFTFVRNGQGKVKTRHSAPVRARHTR